VSSALGGAGLGSSDEGEQILLNPAALVHGSVFTSSLFYIDGYEAEDQHDRALGVTLADNSKDVFFAGSYGYIDRRRTFANQNSRDEQYHQVTIARFVAPHLSVGATYTYLTTNIEGGSTYRQADGHLATHWNPTPELGFGLVFYNVGSRKEEAPKEIQNLDKVAVGVHYIFRPEFRFRMDVSQLLVENPDAKSRYQVGVESHITATFVTRVGFDRDNLADQGGITFGLGFDGPRLKADYFYRKNPDYSEGALHGVDLRLPFW
jgi:hypothetical protein